MQDRTTRNFVQIVSTVLCAALAGAESAADENSRFAEAADNAIQAQRAFKKIDLQVRGWVDLIDPETRLWNGAADAEFGNLYGNIFADEYPFFVLAAALIDSGIFNGPVLDMLKAEIEMYPSLGNRTEREYVQPVSEYLKDGLITIADGIGENAWSERMVSIMDTLWHYAGVSSPYGMVPNLDDIEAPGNLLQVLSRIYWMTGEEKYLDYAIRLGDWYLGDKPAAYPVRMSENPTVIDHGNEHIPGLCELYATVAYARPEKKAIYQQAIHGLVDNLINDVVDDYGLYTESNDTWGYIFCAVSTVYMVDSVEAHKEAVLRALGALSEPPYDEYWQYRGAGWGSDAMADAVEGTLYHLNTWYDEGAAQWVERRMEQTLNEDDKLLPYGHSKFGGNLTRTVMLYALWKTLGTTITPWDSSVALGAARDDDTLYLSLTAGSTWNGKVAIDAPRHTTEMNMSINWQRINYWPEWYTAEPEGVAYLVKNVTTGDEMTLGGAQLCRGFDVQLQPGVEQRYRIHALPSSVASFRPGRRKPVKIMPTRQRPIIAPLLPGLTWQGIPPRSLGPRTAVTILGRRVPGGVYSPDRAGRKTGSTVYLLIPEEAQRER